MRSVVAIIPLLLSTIFLFTAIAPDLQDFQSIVAFATAFDDDECAVCSGYTGAITPRPMGEHLPLPEQTRCIPSPYSTTTHSRASPPSLSIA